MGQNIFLEAGFDDETATVLALEADVALSIAGFIRRNYPNNQTAAAKRLKIGQNEVSQILSGNIGRFSLQKLIRLARRAGLRMFLDMGENAHGAHALTAAPDVVRSTASIAEAEVPNLMVAEEQFELRASAKSARNIVRKQ